MRALFTFSLLTLISTAAPLAVEKMPTFPKVSTIQGVVTNERVLGKPIKLKLKDVLIERATLKVGNKAQIKIELDAFSSLIIFENTVVELPAITWGESEIPEIKLEKGKLFYECEKNCRRYVSTPLSREVFTNGESILEYVPESPYVELTMIHGSQDFKGLENEEGINLKAGQKVVFQGLKESGETAYDFLLKGRKIARGKLQPPVAISESEFKKLVKQFDDKREATKAGPAKVKRTAKQICDKPFGEFNQCTWSASKKGKCQRRRCNANGEWVDSQESIACNPQEKVANCDY